MKAATGRIVRSDKITLSHFPNAGKHGPAVATDALNPSIGWPCPEGRVGLTLSIPSQNGHRMHQEDKAA